MAEKKETDAEFMRKNRKLREENARLSREIAIEEQVTQKWYMLAGIFHDTLWNALRRYDPPCYARLQGETRDCCARSDKAKCPQSRKNEEEARPKDAILQNDAPSSVHEALRAENVHLQQRLTEQTGRHRKWEQTAVRFHDTLWQVLLKYEPDTYGAFSPPHTPGAEPDFSNLPPFPSQEE